MNSHCRNYYKTSREAAGYTQEQAAEGLNISVRSLSAYENGETIPPDATVEGMVRLYQTKLLGWWHLRNTSSLERECLPEIQPPQTNADVYMQIDFSADDVVCLKNMIKGLLADGKITPDELDEFKMLQEAAKIAAGKLMSVYTYEPVITE